MANSMCFTPLTSIKPPTKPGVVTGNSIAPKVLWTSDLTQNCKNAKFQSFEAKATNSNQSTKPNSIVCADCDGNGTTSTIAPNTTVIVTERSPTSFVATQPFASLPDFSGTTGAILCTQCKGTGVNSVDHFNGQFKAGGLCWLCRGKKEILCGNCNGAGFIGGFMSSFDD